MELLLRAVITGFGHSLGKALFDRVKDRLGLDDEPPSQQAVVVDADADADLDTGDEPGRLEQSTAD